MVKTSLVRGMLAGLIGGVLYAMFAYVFGEPSINAAIAYEHQIAAAAGEAHGDELVSRGIQSTLGLLVAAAVFGMAVGGIFALVYAGIYGRVGRLSPRATAAVLAAVGFVVVYLAPFIKYPANPPASTLDGSVSQRTGLYLVMILFSVVLGIGAVALGHRLKNTLGARNATITATLAYLVVIGIIEYVMPVIDETPADFPAPVLYEFRLAAIGGQLVLWATLGVVFGALVDGRSRRRTTQAGGIPAL